MLLPGAGCVFMGFVLYISGIKGENSICAFKGSSVNLPCSYQHVPLEMDWYIVAGYNDLKKLSEEGNHVKYKIKKNRNFTLTINNVTVSDEKNYCCSYKGQPKPCHDKTTKLQVADLQVMVIPSTEGQTVSLFCRTSCSPTVNPAGYIWYKNREVLQQDSSPWYQELVSSDEAVTYSCAVKGYEDHRAPEVSVDSVTPTCFNVTYAKGRMCSPIQALMNEPCSITYPRDVLIQRTPADKDKVQLSCNTSCSLPDPQTDLRLYMITDLEKAQGKPQTTVPITSNASFYCAVKGLKYLHSTKVCAVDGNCRSVNYVRRRICALRGSSVNISTQYSHPSSEKHLSKSWYKIKRNGDKEDPEELTEAEGHVKFHDNTTNHNLTIKNLTKSDSAEFKFRLWKDDRAWKQSSFPGVTLVVTDLTVTFAPSAVVTQGQRVTLTCSTSCPLTQNTNYMWFLNGEPLTQPEKLNKHLVLDPVSSRDEGNYSCGVTTPQSTKSTEVTLTVQTPGIERLTSAGPAAAGVCVTLLVVILLTVFFWIMKKRLSYQSSTTQQPGNMEQLNPESDYVNIPAQAADSHDRHYERLRFSQNRTEDVYCQLEPVSSH